MTVNREIEENCTTSISLTSKKRKVFALFALVFLYLFCLFVLFLFICIFRTCSVFFENVVACLSIENSRFGLILEKRGNHCFSQYYL